jgi:putative transcriptional regulator
MKMSKLSRQTGIAKNSLFDLYHEKVKGVQFETLDKICKALNCSISELLEYVQDGEE